MNGKYCVNCEHSFRGSWSYFCNAPQIVTTETIDDLVLGPRTVSRCSLKHQDCERIRMNEDECGPDAKWFIQKKNPIPQPKTRGGLEMVQIPEGRKDMGFWQWWRSK